MRPAPQLDAGRRIYAVGDVHGRLDLLEELTRRIEDDAARFPAGEATAVFLGDYVDRGPGSRGVIELLASRTIAGRAPVALKGNHEAMMLDFIAGADDGTHWFANGGLETLASYGVWSRGGGARRLGGTDLRGALIEAMPREHVSFLKALPLYHEVGDYLFVHAGVRPGVLLARQTERDLLWIRDAFYQASAPIDRYVVHGHTPVEEPLLLAHRADIDTGAWFSGKLTCLVIEADGRRVLGAP